MEVRCTICSTIVKANLIQYHIRYIHKVHAINYSCTGSSCNRTFNSINSLRNHFRKCHDKLVEEESKNVNYDYISKIDLNIASDETEQFTTVDENTLQNENMTETNEKSFLKTALKIATSLYGDAKLSRIKAEQIITMFNDVLNGHFMNSLKEIIIKSINNSAVNKIQEKFDDLQSSFFQIDTEYKCFQQLQKRHYLIVPKNVIYGYREESN